MSKSEQEFVARTDGAQFTLYAVMRAMGFPLSEEQEKFQTYLERKYGYKEVKNAKNSNQQ